MGNPSWKEFIARMNHLSEHKAGPKNKSEDFTISCLLCDLSSEPSFTSSFIRISCLQFLKYYQFCLNNTFTINITAYHLEKCMCHGW